jgi:hypothetical protein
MFRLMLLGLLLLSNLAIAEPVMVMTTPKCGTHLIQKLLTMLTGQSANFYIPISLDPYSKPEFTNENYIINHPYPGFDDYIESDFKKVVLIRDPKDAIISFVNWVKKDKKWGHWTPQLFIDFYNSLDLNQRIDLAILFPDQYMGLKFFYEQSIRWINSGAFVVRFEDIVGEDGNGNHDTQRDTIANLAAYLDIDINDEKLDYICENLFGDNAGTFDKGLVGSWKSTFNASNKKLIDQEFSHILPILGYESYIIPLPYAQIVSPISPADFMLVNLNGHHYHICVEGHSDTCPCGMDD